MQYHVFDLDGTVIDSRHRYRTLPCGNIDLKHWLKMAESREATFKDKLLPLADTMRRLYNTGHHVIICTSRTRHQNWLDFLSHHRLFAHATLARSEGDMTGDADLKEQMLDDYFSSLGTCLEAERVVMYEDHMGVIERMRSRGVICSIARYE